MGLFPHPGIWLTIFSNIFRICATSLNWKVALLKNVYFIFPSIHWLELFCCRSTTQSCPTLCDPMDCRKPGLSVPHHLPKFTQVHHWCHTVISSSDALVSFCLQSFQASGTFPMSQLFASDDQNTKVSISASVLPTSIQGLFPWRLTWLISLLSKGL